MRKSAFIYDDKRNKVLKIYGFKRKFFSWKSYLLTKTFPDMQIKYSQTFMYNKSVKVINQIKVLKSDSNGQINQPTLLFHKI